MKNLIEYIIEAKNPLKDFESEIASYQVKPSIKGWEFKKDAYKPSKKGKGEFKVSIKGAKKFLNGKDGYNGQYNINIYIYLKAFEFEGNPYISIVCQDVDDWDGRLYNEDFCVLNSIDGINPFINWFLKPHKNTTKSTIGPDGEIKIWYEKLPKLYTPEIKPYVCDKRTITKMGDIVKIECVEPQW